MRVQLRESTRRFAFTVIVGLILFAVPNLAAFGQAIEQQIGFGRVFAVDWNHDGSQYAVSHACTVEIVDAATDETVLRLPRHPDRVHGVAFSSNGKRIATCTWFGTVRVFDTSNGALLLTIPNWQWTVSLHFSRDNRHLLVGGLAKNRSGADAVLYDARTGRRLVTYSGGNGVHDAVISRDGARVLTRGRDDGIRLFDATTGSMVKYLATADRIYGRSTIAFSRDGARAVVTLGGNDALVYDLDSGAVVLTLPGHEDQVRSVDWSDDGTRILTGCGDGTLRLWDATTGAEVEQHSLPLSNLNEVALSPDGTRILSGADDTLPLGVWNADTGVRTGGRDCLWQWAIRDLDWSPDETSVLAASWHEAGILDVSTGRLTKRLEPDPGPDSGYAVTATWITGRPLLVSGTDEHEVTLHDVDTGEALGTFAGHTEYVTDAALTGDGSRMFTCSSDGTARLWNVGTGALERVFSGHTEPVTEVAVSPDETLLATASYDTTVRLWNVATGELVRTFNAPDKEVTCVAFSPDGARLAAGARDRIARIWNVETGKLLQRLDHGEGIESIDFSPDGKLLATAGDYPFGIDPIPYALAKIWNTTSGARVETIPARFLGLRAVAFNASGDRLLTAGTSGPIHLWDWRNDAPKIAAGPLAIPGSAASGKAVRWSLDAFDREDDPIDVIWGFGDGETATGADVLHTYARTGIYRANATYSDGATTQMETARIVIGDPVREEPRLNMRLDFRRENRDRLKLKVDANLGLPASLDTEGLEIEVDVVAAFKGDGSHTGVCVTLDDRGRGEDDGMKVKLRRIRGSDRWRLRLVAANRNFGLAGTAENRSPWNDFVSAKEAPVSVCLRIEGSVVWQSSADHRYKAKRDKTGRLRK